MSILDGYRPIHQHIAPIRYAFDGQRNLVIEEWCGTITTDLLRTHWIKFLADDAVLRCRRTVVDISEAQIDVKGEEFYALIHSLVTPALKGRTWLTAIIVKTNFQYGVSRQYGAYANIYSQDQIFKTAEEAFAWIATRHHEPDSSQGQGNAHA